MPPLKKDEIIKTKKQKKDPYKWNFFFPGKSKYSFESGSLNTFRKALEESDFLMFCGTHC